MSGCLREPLCSSHVIEPRCYRPAPNQLGPEYNLHVLQAFAEHVAPALGWKPNTEGPVQGDPIA